MTFRMVPPVVVIIALAAACTHSDSYSYSAPDVGPARTGADVQLTFELVNYWPTLTEDGSGVLYAFIDGSEATVRPISQFEQPPFGVFPLHIHRCMGVLPIAGGTRHWEYCDNRPQEIDSLTSFPAFAMGHDGRLLYAESTTPRRFTFDTARVSLWLADSATPFRRTLLARMPVVLNDSVINWLADLKWTGPSSFTALGQRAVLLSHGVSTKFDSVFVGQTVLRGSIVGGSATLAAVAGTVGTTAYAVVDSGTAIVFTQMDSTKLMRVSLAGGPVTVVATGVNNAGNQVLGMSCRDSRCIVATGPIGGASQLRRVDLTNGVVSTVFSNGQTVSMPSITSAGDVVAQVGEQYGRIRTSQALSLSIHLYKGAGH